MAHLIRRGDKVSIVSGNLQIESNSGKPVPEQFISSEGDKLIKEILLITSVQGFRFLTHTTGNYELPGLSKALASGVTLQFRDTNTHAEAYAIFNAETCRSRTTSRGKKGSALPPGQFRVAKGSEFLKFWYRAGQTVRNGRLSELHEYMGNLKPIIFAGTVKNDRLDKQSLMPLSIDYQTVRRAVNGLNLTDNSPTTYRQLTDKSHRQEKRESPTTERITTWSYCGEICYDNKVIREHGDKGSSLPPIHPLIQPNEEWLRDYEQPPTKITH